MNGDAAKSTDEKYKHWIDLPENNLRQMLIALIGYNFGPEPETRIPEIRESRKAFANDIADKCRIGRKDIVLDLGSGCGFGTYWLAQKAKHVHACDISPAYLKFAAAECSTLENVTFHLINSRNLGFLQKDALDVVCSMSVFIHFNLYDIFWYFDEFARVVKPGGRVWIDIADAESIDLDTPNVNGQYFLTHAETYRQDDSSLPGLMQWNSLDSVIAIARHAGFENTYKQNGGQLIFEKHSGGAGYARQASARSCVWRGLWELFFAWSRKKKWRESRL